MRWTCLWVLVITASGCAGYPPERSDGAPSPVADSLPVEEDEPEPREPPSPSLTTVVVKVSISGFEVGDTIRVAFDRASNYGLDIPVYGEDGGMQGRAPITALGRIDPGPMAVSASVLNVRTCPNTSCEVAGQVEEGDRVRVEDLQQGWYRLSASDGDDRFVHAEYLMLPLAYQRTLVREVQVSTEEFYETLRGLRMPGYGTVFTDWMVRLESGVLQFRFYTPFMDGPPVIAVCEGMAIIADFVELTLDGIPAEWINAYRAGAYLMTPMNRTDFEVAGVDGRGAIHCRRPY